MQINYLNIHRGHNPVTFDLDTDEGRKKLAEEFARMVRSGTPVMLELGGPGGENYRIQRYDPEKDKLHVEVTETQQAPPDSEPVDEKELGVTVPDSSVPEELKGRVAEVGEQLIATTQKKWGKKTRNTQKRYRVVAVSPTSGEVVALAPVSGGAWESKGVKLGEVSSKPKPNGADAGKYWLRHGNCPHCGGELEISITADLANIMVPADRGPDAWKQGLSDEQLSAVAMAQNTGLLSSFKAVVEYAKTVDRPRVMERFFLTFLKVSVQKVVPPFVVDHFTKAFPRTRLSFFAAQGIVAVCGDGAIRCFIPQNIIYGQRMNTISGNNITRLQADPQMLDEWARTRFGYVAGPGAMFETMKAKSIGEFARPGQ